MRSNRVDSTSPAAIPAATPEPTAPAASAAPATPPTPVGPADRVSLDQVGQVKTLVATGVTMAAAERSERLRHLAQAVRAGTYRPNASQLAEQILAEAELDARLAKTA